MRNILRIFSETRQFTKWYFFMGAFILASSLLSFIGPFLLKNIIDVITAEVTGQAGDITLLWWLLFGTIVSDLATTFITAYGTWMGDILSVRLQTFLSSRFYKHILSLDVGYYDNVAIGNLVNKMYRGIASITSFVQNATNNFLPFFLTAILTIGILSFYSPIVALLLLILFPIYILITHTSSKRWGVHEGKKNAIGDASQGRVFEGLSAIRVVKAYLMEKIEHGVFQKARQEIEKITVVQSKEWHLFDFYRRIALNVVLFAISAYILYQTFHRVYTIGEMTLLLQLVNQARWPLFAMSFIIGQIQQADAGSKDFFEVLSTQAAIKDAPGATRLAWPTKSKKGSSIEFSHVYFSYGSGDVIKDISFTLGYGEKLALVGESGQGKSTLINLLLRYYQKRAGTIRVAGRDTDAVTMESLRKNVSIVFQDSLLFSGTVMENISYGTPGATESQIKEAAAFANADEFIVGLPNGYQTTIGERGVKLSGGQKQRIAIARAILHNAPLIILDEATSALDSKSELLVQKGLEHLTAGKTTIIIAHRLSTISGVDKVLVLAKGEAVQFGSPKELLRNTKGVYAQMIHLQKTLLSASEEERQQALSRFDLVG